MARFCEDCGASVSVRAKFCNSCGQAIPLGSLTEQPISIPANNPKAKRQTIFRAIILFIGALQNRKKVKSHTARPANPKAEKAKPIRTKGNSAYVAWFLFYFFFFGVFTAGIAIPIYIVSVILAFSKAAEKIWRNVTGIRPLRLKSEKARLLPLFKEVYTGVFEADSDLSKGIKLYIKEDMTINAFAFGKSTLVLTRGCLELLSDDCLKGLIAHELGHFSHGDTKAVLLSSVSNFFMMNAISKLTDRKNHYDSENITGIVPAIVKGIYRIFKAIEFIGEVFIKRTSRRNEYLADEFALKSGFGEDLTKVLIEIYSVSISKPQSVMEQLKSTHPDITLRIERLEESTTDINANT